MKNLGRQLLGYAMYNRPITTTSNQSSFVAFLPSCNGMQMVLKCADIGHLAAPAKTHKRWAFQLEEEFFRQVHSPFAIPGVAFCLRFVSLREVHAWQI